MEADRLQFASVKQHLERCSEAHCRPFPVPLYLQYMA